MYLKKIGNNFVNAVLDIPTTQSGVTMHFPTVATEYIQELQLFPSVENKLPVKKKKDSQWDHIRFIPMTYIHLPKTSQNVDNPVKCFQPKYIILRTSTCLQDSSSVISNATHSQSTATINHCLLEQITFPFLQWSMYVVEF